MDAEEGKPGEIWIRGPTIMKVRGFWHSRVSIRTNSFLKGYLNNEAATKDAITPDKWFRTGDIAIRDREGYYYIVDRRKELIKYKVRLFSWRKDPHWFENSDG